MLTLTTTAKAAAEDRMREQVKEEHNSLRLRSDVITKLDGSNDYRRPESLFANGRIRFSAPSARARADTIAPQSRTTDQPANTGPGHLNQFNLQHTAMVEPAEQSDFEDDMSTASDDVEIEVEDGVLGELFGPEPTEAASDDVEVEIDDQDLYSELFRPEPEDEAYTSAAYRPSIAGLDDMEIDNYDTDADVDDDLLERRLEVEH